jgi:hypothetical protein
MVATLYGGAAKVSIFFLITVFSQAVLIDHSFFTDSIRSHWGLIAFFWGLFIFAIMTSTVTISGN